MPQFDVITLGETMIRLTAPHHTRLTQSHSLEVHVGGSESNTAVGLAKLGLRVQWLSRLTDNALGQMIAQQLRGHGVDVNGIAWTSEARVGLYFLEEGKTPRASRIIYDRANSAVCGITPDDLPAQLDTRLLHLTGITLALSESARQTANAALTLAKIGGAIISFDTNYRSKLWSAEAARAICERYMESADLIFIPLKDANAFYGEQPAEAHLSTLAEHFPDRTLVMTLGAEGALAQNPQGELFRQAIFPAEPIGRVGGGDAFSAGFLFGYLRDAYDMQMALRWGAASAALKYATPGDMPQATYQEVLALVKSAGGSGDIQR